MELGKPFGGDADSGMGTPNDYSEDMYRFFFELIDHAGVAREVISKFLGDRHSKSLTTVSFGYELTMPIQCVPELIRLLTREDIAIYQVVRSARTAGVWRSHPSNSMQESIHHVPMATEDYT